jgi:hypothetical protein
VSVTLACAWQPRGEMPRFQEIRPQLEQVYQGVIVSMPPDVNLEDVRTLEEQPKVFVVVTPDWSWGRHLAVQQSLETSASHVHYADLDRLLRWVETKPLEWRQTLEAIQKTDCLIIGRTEKAFSTHPQALQQTETIVNLVFSHLLGRPVDLGGGSRGFSRRAVRFLMTNSPPGRALGTDAEWPILLHRAGFAVDYLAVDGLEWESSARYEQQVGDLDTLRRAADAYDEDAQHWAFRVEVALEIMQAGLAAMQRALIQ